MPISASNTWGCEQRIAESALDYAGLARFKTRIPMDIDKSQQKLLRVLYTS